MYDTPIIFKFERRTMLPIVTITGVADSIPGIDNFMLAVAVEMIEKAEKYNGKIVVIAEQETIIGEIPKGKTAVRFNIIFRNEEEFMKGMEGFQRELG